MSSTELLTDPLAGLDVELDKRDWIGQFPAESDTSRDLLRRKSETIFAVVRHGRPMPILLPEPPAGTEIRPSGHRHHRSLSRRIKRAISPTLTALLVAYVAIVIMTAWIGVRRGEGAKADSTPQVSTPPADTFGPANRP